MTRRVDCRHDRPRTGTTRRLLAAIALVIAMIGSTTVSGECNYKEEGQDLRLCPMKELLSEHGPIDLSLTAYRFESVGWSMWTRAYAGPDGIPSIPGPIIRMKRGTKVRLRLTNQLGTNQEAATSINGFHAPNTTNLHTHGLHVSGESPGDDASVSIAPGGASHQYEYDLPSDHASGLHFYHPHRHGSVTVQLGGGAFGMLIVDDDPTNSPFDFLAPLPLIHLSLWQFTSGTHTSNAAESADTLTMITGTTPTTVMFVNGLQSPIITVNPDQFYRYRIQYSSVQTVLQASIPDCTMILLAIDGTWLNVPRTVERLRFLMPTRLEVAIQCPAGGPYMLNDDVENRPILTIIVGETADQGPTALDLTKWAFERPSYLSDTIGLSDEAVQSKGFKLTIGLHGGQINGAMWRGVDHQYSLHDMKPNTIEEWIIDVTEHPIHVHGAPFQLQSDAGDGFYMKGDWVDTYVGALMKVRTHIDDFNGPIIVHCHVSNHADLGLAGIMWINGTPKGSSSLSTFLIILIVIASLLIIGITVFGLYLAIKRRQTQ